jgi:rhodanese-related sulfurtransferase
MKRMIVLVTAVFLTVPGLASAAFKDLAADTLVKWMTNGPPSDFILIDVRDPSELLSSDIIGNQNCRPYNLSLNLGALDSTMAQLPKNALIVCYCRGSVRSDTATQRLVNNGFTSAYSLNVGFSTWKGPTIPAANVKPRAELPAPSMLKATATLPRQPADLLAGLVRPKDDWICSTAPLATPHVLELLDMQGKCITTAIDPFRASVRYRIPPWVARGEYLISLQIAGSRNEGFTIAVKR